MEASSRVMVQVLMLALVVQVTLSQHWSYGWLPGGKRSVGELEATIRISNPPWFHCVQMMGTGGVVSLPDEASAQTQERLRPYNVTEHHTNRLVHKGPGFMNCADTVEAPHCSSVVVMHANEPKPTGTTGKRYPMGPVRLPFGLGSLCLPADVSETHTCSGALKQTGAIRHSSRYTRSVGTRPWFRSNGPQTVGQRPSLVMNPPYHESYSLVPLYPLHSNQPRPSLPLFMVRSFFTQALERTEVAQVSQIDKADAARRMRYLGPTPKGIHRP
ncbi:hypothetical protein F7725_023932 [Dissostichus mawsoni]|uniref:Progonadoliberin n=1 Tax=Dissostichus mawsoni TaxID=36200 RepID=A0A7J5XYN6_DISMA|nr:hypothetical protein F7725_023932 [Dissostichus mawsoni]